MDWYYGSHIDDFAVPKDDDIFDRFPSPDNWPTWGTIIGNYNSPKKHTTLGVEEILHSGTSSSGDSEQLTSSRVCQGSEHARQGQNAFTPLHSDLQINDLDMIVEADDIFFHSLFEDATEVVGTERPSKLTRSSSTDDTISVNLSGAWHHHNHDCTNDVDNIGPLAKEPEFDIEVSEEPSTRYDADKNLPMEECVLLELQRSTLQLTDKIRLCFRDSLYRLAENSRHNTRCSHNEKVAKDCKPTSSNASSRLQETETQGAHTNAIDRTIATLLFNFPLAGENLTEQSLYGEIQQASSNLYSPSFSISSMLSSIPENDAEVPAFGLMDQPLTLREAYHHCRSLPYCGLK